MLCPDRWLDWVALFGVLFPLSSRSMFPVFVYACIVDLLVSSDVLFRSLIHLHFDKKKKELLVCQSLLCLDLVSFPMLSQIKP